MAQRLERDFVALQQQLIAQDIDRRGVLETDIEAVEGAKQEVEALQAELRANVAEFNRLMSESVRSITALGDSVFGDFAQQLGDRDDDVERALTNLRARAATLEGALDQVDVSVAALAERLPDLDSGMSRLAERLEASEADFGRVASQVETIEVKAPEIALWLEGQRQGLARTLESRRQAVDQLDFEIATLKGNLNESRGDLQTFQGTLERDIARTRQQDEALEQAIEEARATELQAAELVSQIDARAASAQSELQKRIDTVLSDLAEAADLAVRRSEDLTKRGEAEATRRLRAAGEQAVESVLEAREQHLAELSQVAIATRTELDRTRAGLVGGWRGMDEAVAERHARVLADLDRHAATLEGRVQQLLEALNVIVARGSNG
jgi:chromosome segregation ATPase